MTLDLPSSSCIRVFRIHLWAMVHPQLQLLLLLVANEQIESLHFAMTVVWFCIM
jgi:hypothetical protein